MDKIIKAGVDRGASDLHTKAGDMFRARLNGTLVALSKQRLTPNDSRLHSRRLPAIRNADL